MVVLNDGQNGGCIHEVPPGYQGRHVDVVREDVVSDQLAKQQDQVAKSRPSFMAGILVCNECNVGADDIDAS